VHIYSHPLPSDHFPSHFQSIVSIVSIISISALHKTQRLVQGVIVTASSARHFYYKKTSPLTTTPHSSSTMSPIAFKQQVDQLAAELTKCIEFCEDIRTNRRLGNTQESLDRLQSALETAEVTIPASYKDVRRRTGSRMDIGDEKARGEMNQHILDVQSIITPRLQDIAHPPRRHSRHEKQQAGFAELHRQWKDICQDVSETIHSLSRRITTTTIPAPPSAPTPPSPLKSNGMPTPPSSPGSKSRKADEITIPVQEFHQLLAHMRNSWEEIIVDGKILYVNVLDPQKKQREVPAGAYVKACPRPGVVRRGSFHRPSPYSRTLDQAWEGKVL
jgi:hypothetical protein